MSVTEILSFIINDTDLHAKWLNSLSYLEYRGLRKILRSQKTENMDLELLEHAFEESRHALYFKKLAIKIGGDKFSSYQSENTLSLNSLRQYFFQVDSLGASQEEKLEKAIYELVTWLLEERALAVYQEYERLLQKTNSQISIKAILADEEKHLNNMRSTARLNDVNKKNLLNLENQYFNELTQSIQKDLFQ